MACKIIVLLASLITVVFTDPNGNGENKVESLELAGLDSRRAIFHQKNKNTDGSILGTYGYYDSYERYHVLNYINTTLGVQVVNDYLPFEPLNGLLFNNRLPPPTESSEENLPKPVFTPDADKKANGTGEGLDTNEHSVIRSTVLPPPPSFEFFQPFAFDIRPQQIDQQGTDVHPSNDTESTAIYSAPYPHILHGLVRVADNSSDAASDQPSQIPFTPLNLQNFPFAEHNPGFPFTYYAPTRQLIQGANDTSGLDSTDGEAQPNDPVELAPVKPDQTETKEQSPTTTNRVGPQPTLPPFPRVPQQPGLLSSFFNQYPPFSPFEGGVQQNAYGSYPSFPPYPYYGYSGSR